MENRWGSNGNSDRFYFLELQNHSDGDCSYRIKRCLLFWRKAITKLDNISKSRDITLPKKVHLVKGMFLFLFFSSSFVWMWDLVHKEVWMLKNWCFWTWSWRRLLRVLWPARRSSQSILKGINPDYSSEGLMLRLELQYFGHLMWGADSLEKTMMLGKIEGRRRRGWQRTR